MNRISPFTSFNLINDMIKNDCIYKGSFVLYVALLNEDMDANRYVKDLDIMVSYCKDQNKLAETVRKILSDETKEEIVESINKSGVIQLKNNVFNEVKNITERLSVIDIVNSRNIEYKQYYFNESNFNGSTVYQMLTDKLNSCATVNYHRVEKDMIDIKIILECFNINLLDLLDCMNLNKQNLYQYESIINNINKVSKLLGNNITFHKSQEFSKFFF